jgi:hypothetical protein
MPSYVVETLVDPRAPGQCTAREWRARAVAGQLRREGVRVRFDRVVQGPDQTRCSFVFQAGSWDEAALVAELAELDPVRVVEAAPPERRASTG